MLLRNKNYFQIFSILESYQLDLDTLTKNYRKLQEKFHPDTASDGTEQEKLNAIQTTSLINEAFETLVAPTKRAAYLLQLLGVDVSKVRQSDLSQGLLLEQIQFREELEDVPGDESAIDKLNELRAKFQSRMENCQNNYAHHIETKMLSAAKSDYYEMQYFYKLMLEIDVIEEDLLGF